MANWPGLGRGLHQQGHNRPGGEAEESGLHFLIQAQIAHVAHHAHDLVEGLLRIHDAENEPFANRVLIREIAASQRFID